MASFKVDACGWRDKCFKMMMLGMMLFKDDGVKADVVGLLHDDMVKDDVSRPP